MGARKVNIFRNLRGPAIGLTVSGWRATLATGVGGGVFEDVLVPRILLFAYLAAFEE